MIFRVTYYSKVRSTMSLYLNINLYKLKYIILHNVHTTPIIIVIEYDLKFLYAMKLVPPKDLGSIVHHNIIC